MNKKDVLIMVGLMGLLFLWGPIDKHFIKPTFFPDAPVPEETDQTGQPEEAVPQPIDVAEAPLPIPAADQAEEALAEIAPAPVAEHALDEAPAPVTPEPAPEPPAEERIEETLIEVATERMTVSFSSRGGTIARIVMHDFDELNEPDSPPVVMEFGEQRALAIERFSGLTQRHHFEAEPLLGGDGVRFSTDLPYGLRFVREIRVTDDYVFHVTDTFQNQLQQPLQLPAFRLVTGRMEPVPGVSSTYGMFPLGVDTLLPADSVKRWGKDLHNRWMRQTTADIVTQPLNTPVDWVAVKNKYFVQSLRPRTLDTENSTVFIEASPTREPAAIWAALQFPTSTLAAGNEFSREYVLFAGPQELDRLRAIGFHQDRILELGWAPIRFFAGLLMVGLSGIYGVFGNYGVAIMLLTVIIRILFWPLTHKGTESMRRMQEVAPLMKELNEKYKDDAQKRQQAMMELYKEHKINPLGGCLPMIVQIPVFISLFYLLRTAVELRYASFLWIDDLSEPEGILGDVLPLPLNILPIFMAVTMYFQQKLTPMASTGSEQQVQVQKTMMRVMPIMMLVLLYNFASGLALYWSTQNVLMIVQQALYRRRRALQEQSAVGK